VTVGLFILYIVPPSTMLFNDFHGDFLISDLPLPEDFSVWGASKIFWIIKKLYNFLQTLLILGFEVFKGVYAALNCLRCIDRQDFVIETALVHKAQDSKHFVVRLSLKFCNFVL
jgi:hypothetical protein